MVTVCNMYGKQRRGKLHSEKLVLWVCSNKLSFHMVEWKAINQGENDGNHMNRAIT